jgi:predicted nuclease of predicted toxin-antitoxin system
LKFLVDMPVTPLAVTHLRTIGHDAVHAHEIGLARASDILLLDAARQLLGLSAIRFAAASLSWRR